MALSMLVAIIAAPALLGTQEAIRQSQGKEKREEHRARRCNLIATCVKSSMRSREINGRPIVLRNGKLWIDTGTSDGQPYGHPYAGYYLPYPDSPYEGLVTTITDEAPIMNWVYIDAKTYEVKYGVRANAQSNLTGPFDCTRQDRRLTFEGWEGWCAVEEFPTLWALYFDKDDNGLVGKVAEGTRVLEIELSRKEKRWKKEAAERQEDQTTKREVEAKEDAPVDNPVTVEPQLNPPGVLQDGVRDGERDGRMDRRNAVPEPFPIPKSIFETPRTLPIPKSIFERPQTPPPAYSVRSETPPSETLPSKASPVESFSMEGVSVQSPLPPDSKATQPAVATELAKTPPPPPLVALLPTSPKAATPSFKTPSPPTTTEPRSTPLMERRNTPKLNRNSGTRALAQAQMFEAMIQDPKNSSSRNSISASRPISTANSSSEYSDQRLSTEILQAYLTRPDSSILTPSAPVIIPPSEQPRSLQPSAPVADPAVFGGSSDRGFAGSLQQEDMKTKGDAIKPFRLRRKPSLLETQQSRPPKEALPPLPSSSSVKRRPSASASKGPIRRDKSNTVSYSTSITTRQRGASTSSQKDEPSRSSPRPLVRTATAPAPTRKSMAATMTTGVMTSMARKMIPPSPPALPRRERKNSGLYREIDDILKPDRGRAGSNASMGLARGAGSNDRPPALRRVATSRGRVRSPSGASTAMRPAPPTAAERGSGDKRGT